MRVTSFKLSSACMVEGRGNVRYCRVGETGAAGERACSSIELDPDTGLLMVRWPDGGIIGIPSVKCDWVKFESAATDAKAGKTKPTPAA